MNNKRKKTNALLLVSTFLILTNLAGCGKNNPSTPISSTENPISSTSPITSTSSSTTSSSSSSSSSSSIDPIVEQSKQILAKVKEAYKTYLETESSYNKNSDELLADATKFLNYLDAHNIVTKDNLNLSLIKNVEVPEGGDINNSYGAIIFLIRTVGDYFCTISTYTLNNNLTSITYQKDNINKDLQEVTKDSTTSKVPTIEDTWEYPIDTETLKSNIDAPIITINFVKDEEILKSITMRYGKRLPSGLMSNIAIGSSQIYVSKNEFENSTYNELDGLYYYQGTCSWNNTASITYDSLIELNKPITADIAEITNNTLTFTYSSNETIVPFEPVAYKTRVANDEKTTSYFFADGDSAFTLLGSYSLNDEKHYDTLNITSSITLTSNYVIEEGVNVNLIQNDFDLVANPSFYKFADNQSAVSDEEILNYEKHGSVTMSLTNASIDLKGSLNITGTIKTTSGGQTNSGAVYESEFAEVILDKDSSIVLTSDNSVLNAYGRITGEGTINATKGIVNDKFVMRDWKGGSNLLVCATSLKGKSFPFYQYYLPDISVKLNIYQEAKYSLFTSFYASDQNLSANIELIGPNGLFTIDNGYISKELQKESGNSSMNIVGDIHTNSIKLSLSSYNFNGDNYFFPLYGMNINITSNSTVNLSGQKFEVMPNSSINIEENALLKINSQLVIYDSFNYFEASNSFKNMYTQFASFPGALVSNHGTIEIADGTALAGNIHNSGTITYNENNITKSITPVVIIGVKTKIFAVYADTSAIEFKIIEE